MMRTFILELLLVIAPGMLSGCCTGMRTKPAPLVATQSDKIADSKIWVMQSSGVDVLKLTTAADTKCLAGDGTLHFNGPLLFDEVEIWRVRGAKTVDEATGHVDTQIADQFKDFKPDHTTDLTIAGSPAKRLGGPGHEADDGDAGAADVIVFKVGEHIFVACSHGESLDPSGEQWMLTLVQTAQTPFHLE
jgi:hypothetical protein